MHCMHISANTCQSYLKKSSSMYCHSHLQACFRCLNALASIIYTRMCVISVYVCVYNIYVYARSAHTYYAMSIVTPAPHDKRPSLEIHYSYLHVHVYVHMLVYTTQQNDYRAWIQSEQWCLQQDISANAFSHLYKHMNGNTNMHFVAYSQV